MLDDAVGDPRDDETSRDATKEESNSSGSNLSPFPRRDRSCGWHRYEVKYMVDAATASELQHFCQKHIPADPYSRKSANGQYPILSYYLDSPDRQCYRSTIERRVERFKLRVRTYRHFSETIDGPLFFEIKRKLHGIINKTRARVPLNYGFQCLWEGRRLDRSCEGGNPADSLDEVTLGNANEFLDMRDQFRARPVVGVYYSREAYEADTSDSVRVTFDRDLHFGVPGSQKKYMWWPVSTGGTIVEVKFTTSYPSWIRDILHRHDFNRRGICKYAMCYEGAYGSTAQAGP